MVTTKNENRVFGCMHVYENARKFHTQAKRMKAMPVYVAVGPAILIYDHFILPFNIQKL